MGLWWKKIQILQIKMAKKLMENRRKYKIRKCSGLGLATSLNKIYDIIPFFIIWHLHLKEFNPRLFYVILILDDEKNAYCKVKC
jgi:hypothetical protein